MKILFFSRRHSNAKQWSIGKKRFNDSPKEVNRFHRKFVLFNLFFKGIRWLIENNLIQNTPEHTAAFLFNETGLSKRAIGDYLGEKYED
jgi:cytohesin